MYICIIEREGKIVLSYSQRLFENNFPIIFQIHSTIYQSNFHNSIFDKINFEIVGVRKFNIVFKEIILPYCDVRKLRAGEKMPNVQIIQKQRSFSVENCL